LLSKQQIRKEIRMKRQSLSIIESEFAGKRVYQNLNQYSPLFRAKKIACYLPNDGEVSLSFLIDKLLARKKNPCLPVLFGYRKRVMHFAAYSPSSAMKNNKYGIPEPAIPIKRQIKPVELDIVLLPLVAFDEKGNRLGMGGGFYDRSFSFLHRRKFNRKPKLVGVAYDFQQMDNLSRDSWDVPLDAVVTESRLIKIT